MKRNSPVSPVSPSMMEHLESRTLLSGTSVSATPQIHSNTRVSVAVTFKHTVYVTRTSLTVTRARVDLGAPVTLNARFTGGLGPIPVGSTVQFGDGSTLLGTSTVSATGHATLTINNLYTGSHSFAAYLIGSTHYTASQSKPVAFTVRNPTTTRVPGGLRTATVIPGIGAGAVNGDVLTADYTGFLANGTKFDSSLNTGRTPLQFTLGHGDVIKGWDQGLVGIEVGETRDLFIPPALAYGTGAHAGIPPNSTLIFVVTRLSGNSAPTVATPAAATPNPATNKTTNLIALGADNGGEANLTYTWSATGSPPAPVTFSINGTNAAKHTTATFTVAGSYSLLVTISDGTNTVTSPVTVTVN